MDGIINVYKEKGYTSHDVVAKLRGILRERKIGHTGTLDPEAEGVLPVCIGKATKVCDLLADQSKTYRTVLLLGVKTDTQDITGNILNEFPVNISEEDVLNCLKKFVGVQLQTPPMYSAKKINGKKLYELARQGLEVDREPCTINVKKIMVEAIDLPEIEMTIECSKGTYIRTLCNDIGESLGCGGCMKSLIRTKVGPFSMEKSSRISELETLKAAGKINEVLLPTDYVFHEMDRIDLTPEAERLVKNGNPLSSDLFSKCQRTIVPKTYEKNQVRLYSKDGNFLALYEFRPEKNSWRALKMFL